MGSLIATSGQLWSPGKEKSRENTLVAVEKICCPRDSERPPLNCSQTQTLASFLPFVQPQERTYFVCEGDSFYITARSALGLFPLTAAMGGEGPHFTVQDAQNIACMT